MVPDAHQGLRGAIAAVFGGASWQRCRTHFMTNLLTRVPRRVQPWVATMVRTIYQQPSPDEVHAQLDRVTDQLQDRFPQVASLLDEAGPDILAFSSFPVPHWKKIWSNNPQERLIKEIRRRTDVVGIFPNRPAGSASLRLGLLEGELPVLADRWVAGVQADDLVVVPYRLVRLAQVAVQNRPAAEGLDVVRVEGDGPPEVLYRHVRLAQLGVGRTLSCSTPPGRPG